MNFHIKRDTTPRPTAGQLGRTTGVASWESTQEGYARSLTLASQ